MEPVQSRRIVALSVAVTLVTVALSFDRPATPPARVELYAPPEAVDRIVIERGGQSTVLLRRGDGWWVGGATDQPAEPTEVRRLLDALAGLQFADPVAVPIDADPAAFGLGDEPWATIVVEGPQGLQTLTLGTPAEVGVRSYARGPGGQTVVVASAPHALLDQPPSAFVDHRLFAWSPEEVAGLALTGPDGPWTIRRSGAHWIVADRFRADPERVAAVLRVWSSVRLDPMPLRSMPVDSVTTDGRSGERTLRVEHRDGSHLEARFVVDGPSTWTVVSSGAAGRADVDPRLWDLTPRQLAADQLIGLDRSAADRVSLALGTVTWEGRRNGPGWESSLGDGASWDIVSALASAPQLESASARRRPRDPWGRLTVEQADDTWTVALDRDRDGVHLAWWADAPLPVAVPEEAIRAVLDEVIAE